MFCNFCGKELPDGSAFCNFCGKQLGAPAAAPAAPAPAAPAPSGEGIKEKLTSGRDAKKRKDWRGVERFYGAVLLECPTNFEAVFYDAYAKAMETMSVNEVFKRKDEMTVLHNIMNEIPDHYDPNDEENCQIINDILVDLKALICCSFVFTQTKNGYGMVISSNADQTYSIFVQTIKNFRKLIDSLAAREDKIAFRRSAVEFYSAATGLSWDYSNKVAIMNDLKKWVEEEKEIVEKLRRIPIDAYWAEHPDEKKALEDEKDAANNEIAELNAQIEAMGEFAELKRLEDEMAELESQISGSGITGALKEVGSSAKEKGFKSLLGVKDAFSGKMKEKKDLKEKKTELQGGIDAAKAALEAASKSQNERIDALKARIGEIDAEFDKDR